jgi:hypothetical protein
VAVVGEPAVHVLAGAVVGLVGRHPLGLDGGGGAPGYEEVTAGCVGGDQSGVGSGWEAELRQVQREAGFVLVQAGGGGGQAQGAQDRAGRGSGSGGALHGLALERSWQTGEVATGR